MELPFKPSISGSCNDESQFSMISITKLFACGPWRPSIFIKLSPLKERASRGVGQHKYLGTLDPVDNNLLFSALAHPHFNGFGVSVFSHG